MAAAALWSQGTATGPLCTGRNGRNWPKADMAMRDSDVRFRGQSGLPLRPGECLLLTQIGHGEPHDEPMSAPSGVIV
jgi:hypothetical protein